MSVLATHVIWTTYMTWPPGDPRGHWSPLFDAHGQVLDRGGHLQPGDGSTLSFARQSANEPAKILSETEMNVVGKTIGMHVRLSGDPSNDKPIALAAAIESTHVHLLLGPIEEEINKCIGRIKGRSSSAVLTGSPDPRRRVWTAGFWKVFLFDRERIAIVKRYIDAHNERRGLPAEPYPWITRIT